MVQVLATALEKASVEINARDKDGLTPLHYVRDLDSITAKILLKYPNSGVEEYNDVHCIEKRREHGDGVILDSSYPFPKYWK